MTKACGFNTAQTEHVARLGTSFLGNGREYGTVCEYLDILGRNAYSLMAAGAVVQPQTQFLISLLSERGRVARWTLTR